MKIVGASRQFDALTSLRFFLAILVMVGHWLAHVPAALVEKYQSPLFYSAPTAVSWFFILSGFVIAYNYPTLETPGERKTFFALRFARLWPVHIITFLAMIALHGGGKYYPFFLTMTHSWTANANMGMAYNGPSWSISDELFFYVCYIGLAAPQKWIRAVVAVVPIIASAALLLSLRCYLPTEPGTTNQCFSILWIWPPTRFIEFLAGVAIFRLGIRVPQVVGLGLAFAFLTGHLPSLPPTENPVFIHWMWQAENIICGGALISSLAKRGWLSQALAIPPLIIGGEISYSMYMTHQVVNFSLYDRLPDLGVSGKLCVLVVVTISLSLVLFYFVERPSRNFVKRRLRRSSQATGADQAGIAQPELPLGTVNQRA